VKPNARSIADNSIDGEWVDRGLFDALVYTSGMLWLLEAPDRWMTPPGWSYFEGTR
jgi:hypothetical protein